MRRFALQDADNQATLRVLAEFHSKYQRDEAAQQLYCERLQELASAHRDLVPLQTYVHEVMESAAAR
jgi:hypothetical protein